GQVTEQVSGRGGAKRVGARLILDGHGPLGRGVVGWHRRRGAVITRQGKHLGNFEFFFFLTHSHTLFYSHPHCTLSILLFIISHLFAPSASPPFFSSSASSPIPTHTLSLSLSAIHITSASAVSPAHVCADFSHTSLFGQFT